MEDLQQMEIRERYMAALDSFVEKVKDDPNVIAVIIYGSLAYDVLWEKSDIDMELVVREQTLKNRSYCIVEDDITINVNLVLRNEFKRYMERSVGGTFLSKGKIIYTTDDSLYEYFEELKTIGKDDIALKAFHIASHLVYLHEKSQKWLVARKDPLYAQYFLLDAAEVIANMELCLSGQTSSRETIQKGIQLNPDAIQPFYQDAMSHHFSHEEVKEAIDKIDQYLMKHIDVFKKPILDFLEDQEMKTVTMIAKHFNTEGHFILGILDYLADKGIIEKASQTIRITPKSKLAVEELGYLYMP